jgi:hypothetical protein
MRSAGNFSPEWGYLAPAPNFMRTARIVVVATAIGAIAGAGVVLSLVDRPAADNDQASVSAHAIVSSVETAPATAAASNATAAAPVNITTAAPAPVLPASPVVSRAANPPTPANVPAENPDLGKSTDLGKSPDLSKANVYPVPKPVQGMAALSDGSPASDAAPADAAYGAVGAAQGKKDPHHVADPFAPSKPPALGTMLRRLFSAHNGNSYFPNN